MNEHLALKIIYLCVAYMDGAGGVPMRGVSRSGSFVKLSNSWAKAGPMSEAIALGLACVPRLDLDPFESQSDSPRLNQRLPGFRY